MKHIAVALIILSLIILPVAAEDDGGENEFGQGFGSVSIGLLWIGAIYVVVRRLYTAIKTYDLLEEDMQKKAKDIFFRIRPYLYTIHAWALIASTIFAVVHGLFLLNELQFVQITGIIAALAMVLSSISGFLIWRKVRVIWSNKEARTLVRTSHKQWTLTIILLVFLFIHLGSS